MPPFEELVHLSSGEPGHWCLARKRRSRASSRPALRRRRTRKVLGQEFGMPVRGACTPFPQALLFGVIAQAVAIEAELMAARRKRAGALPHR